MGRSSVIPFGERIAQARKAHKVHGNMPQKQLAGLAGVSLRTIERAEASEPIGRSSFEQVVKVLVGRIDASRLKDELWKDELWKDELFLYQKFDVERGDDARTWLAAASRFDQRDEPRRAADCVKVVVDSLKPTHPCHADACIQLAVFYDHLNLFEEAVEAANRVIDRRGTRGQSDDSRLWARFQRGIASRRMAERLRSRSWTLTPAVRELLEAARADFETVRARGDERHQVSALHHLAVLDIHVGRYSEAIKSLEECVRVRERAEGKPPEDIQARTRLAYEYRRLGQCCAQLFHRGGDEKFRDEARRHFSRARELAAGNARVLREIDDDVGAFGPGLE